MLSGWGGVGKTQLARTYVDAELRGDPHTVVVWAPAGDPAQIVTLFADAAARLLLPGVDVNAPELSARRFLTWLRHADHRWLVVLDDITDLDAVEPWWPTTDTGNGWVLATTRMRDEARLTAGGRALVDVDVYSEGEAYEFLTRRLTECRCAWALAPVEGGDADPVAAVAAELGRLPLGLSLAAQYIATEKISCQEYVNRYRSLPLAEVMPGVEEDYRSREGRDRRVIAAAMTLSLPAAEAANPAGYGTAAMKLISVLDPNGHPEAFWSTTAALNWLRDQRASVAQDGRDVTPALARQVLLLLHRYGLINYNAESPHRTITVHALTQRSVLEAL